VFGPGWAIPLDRNAKARIAAYARAWSARNARQGQHHGPVTMACRRVLDALLWSFHNSRSGACFPSYAAIAERAGCCRRTVAEALRVLEWAGVLSWQRRLARVRERCRCLLTGRDGWRWRVIRTSNAYVLRDPGAAARYPAAGRAFPSECKNPPGTLNQLVSSLELVAARDPDSPLERALASLGALVARKDAHEGSH
jgi:hypothetical protein